jgi:hypothetical protein
MSRRRRNSRHGGVFDLKRSWVNWVENGAVARNYATQCDVAVEFVNRREGNHGCVLEMGG